MTRPPDRIHAAASVGFEAAADRYDRGRPSYPPAAIAAFVQALGIERGTDVLELGAGTGKFTALLVPTGARVTAVEPVAAMRAVLERNVPSACVLEGTAESIPVADRSSDAVAVAQAFHWFDAEQALVEIGRVLRPRGRLGMIWNVRDERPTWSRRLTAIYDRLSGEGNPRYKHLAWRPAFDRSDAFKPLEHRSYPYVHDATREAFLDRVLSVSYVASASPDVRDEITRQVTELLETDPELTGRDTIAMPYTTDVYWCERR
ncbi:MAG TPA: class I SAM-dependent methyltransferase [Actinomycetota bacterium]|nr:class I SAM-dependent methyltransferase [Actinomycetota bacterium]